ncbi:alpha-L-fucosidase [Seonamhaeicola sp.]|uniref:alpha-L-fucosidase n=1 Tax=Seonamhaeicola sp. TaxID=1912245 RepID=UPI00260C776B|nr:alpha-L-fucosidase [Seonamhaeicola sp.]
MKLQKKIITYLGLALVLGCNKTVDEKKTDTIDYYEPTWESLTNHETPKWLKDGKFGIYTHWGIYCYSGINGNVTWNSSVAYMDPESTWGRDFERVHGKLTPEFGYKDLIPKFTGENFNAEEWADLFAKSGAKFAGPVAEHHDGFAMWDTEYSEWNSAKMGPKRDVVGELGKAIKGKGMKFVTAFHHSANWYFFPTWDKTKDASNPEYSGLYGPIHEEGDVPNKEYLDEWKGKLVEVVDKYEPDFVWFDFALDIIREDYVKDFVAHYYNSGLKRNEEVIISYKHNDLPTGAGLFDLELGAATKLTQYDWITDTTIDNGPAWGYRSNLEYEPVNNLIDNLVYRVSNNGALLLNVGPKWDGSIPEKAKEALLGMGEWLKINGEAIYGTRAWSKSGEGPGSEGSEAEIEVIDDLKDMNEDHEEEADEDDNEGADFGSKDIRFTTKGNILYATILGWPGESVIIKSLVRHSGEITGKQAWGYVDLDEDLPGHIGGYYLYPDEIESITMLGDGKPLDWELIPAVGLMVKMPETKPCEHAYVLKIVRK